MRSNPLLCPLSKNLINDPVIVNLPGLAPIVYERSSVLEAAKRGEFEQARTGLKLAAEIVQDYLVPFELAQALIKEFENPDPIIGLNELERLCQDPITQSFPESPALLCVVDGRIYGEKSMANLLSSTNRSPINRKLINARSSFFKHPLFEKLLLAIKKAKENNKDSINLEEVYQDYSSEENYVSLHHQAFDVGYDSLLKMTTLMIAGTVQGISGLWPAVKTLPLPAVKLGCAMGMLAYAFNSSTPALLFPQLMHSQGSERLRALENFSKRYYLEYVLFALITAGQLTRIRYDEAATEIIGWYDAGQSFTTLRNMSVFALGASYELGISYAEYWKVSTTFHLLLANRNKYAHEINGFISQALNSPKNWIRMILMANIIFRGALYPLFIKPASTSPMFEEAYYLGTSYLLYRRIDCILAPRPIERHQDLGPEPLFLGFEWFAKAVLFITLFIASGKMLGFGSFELWSLLIVKLGEFAMVSELKEQVAGSRQNVTFVPGEAQNLYRLKARVEILPDNQEEEVQQVVARLN